MQSTLHRLLLSVLVSALMALTAGSASAQLTGNISGTLPGNTVYTSELIRLEPGQTLTIEAGAVIKFMEIGNFFQIEGQLIVKGTAQNPVIFTSIHDDSAGGDTNGNGSATMAAPGDWQGLLFLAGSSGTVEHCENRFGGFGTRSFELRGAAIDFSDCLVRDTISSGWDLTGQTPGSTFTRCHAVRCQGRAFDFVPAMAMADFLDCTAQGCGANAVSVRGNGIIGSDLTVQPRNGIEGSVLISTQLRVNAGVLLTVEPGTSFKHDVIDSRWTVNGSLDARGTAGSPIVFTEFRDDSVGGDTNGDGAISGPGPGRWQSVDFEPGSGPHDLRFCEFRYAGRAGTAISVGDVSVEMTDCLIRDSMRSGIDCRLSQTPCRFERLRLVGGGPDDAIRGVRLDRVPDFVDCVAIGNQRNRMRVGQARVMDAV
ncbi:MAG: hypothetical protein AAGG01_09300, partial [Planctomycetota bacterium]